MASLNIHWAIANVYLQTHPEIDRAQFKKGAAEPDIIAFYGAPDQKFVAHYSDQQMREREITETGDYSIETMFRSKVDLHRFVHSQELGDDFWLGYFCHLVADYYFFNCFLDPARFGHDRKKFRLIYPDYERVAQHICTLYNIDNVDNPWQGLSRPGTPECFTIDEICQFINRCGSIDLSTLHSLLLESSPDSWRQNIAELWTKTPATPPPFPLRRL